ncbi:MAG: hypothetical protein IPH48_01065 [bacterium]|nr:hypothetical protein [bacterium]
MRVLPWRSPGRAVEDSQWRALLRRECRLPRGLTIAETGGIDIGKHIADRQEEECDREQQAP